MKFRKMLHRSAALLFAFFLTVTISLQAPFAKSAQAADTLGLAAKSAILVDYNTGDILYEKDADHVYPPASMTKMMTEYLVMKALHDKKLTWNSKVSISDYAYTISQNRSFSNVPLRKDYQYTVRELYEAMAIYSANGATIALAEKIGGTEKHFVDMMNATAKRIGMTESHYINSSGLDNVDLGKYAPYGTTNDSNELSAHDIARLAYHVIHDYPEALQISKIPLKNFTAGVDTPIQMVNWDYMLPGFGADMAKFTYPGVDGLKTGHTDAAGYCFTGTVDRDGHRLISVVMGTSSDDERFEQTKALFDYGYQQFALKTIAKKGQLIKGKTAIVHNGKQAQVKLAFGGTVTQIVTNGEKSAASYDIVLDRNKLNKDGSIEAPVKMGERVGYAVVKPANATLYPDAQKVPVIAASEVDRSNWFVRLFHAIGGLFSGLFHWIANLF
ncbi:MAG: serine hydrolase [Sporolactobacillus sp.]